MEGLKINHAVTVSEEAMFDYETTMEDEIIFPSKLKQDVKTQIKEFIILNPKYQFKRYFKVKYLDETTDQMLMIFVRKGKLLFNCQYWNVVGICKFEDYSQDLEEEGFIKVWLDSKITDLEVEVDWVEEYRINLIIKNLESLYEEDRNEFERINALFVAKLQENSSNDKRKRVRSDKRKPRIARKDITAGKAVELLELLHITSY